MEVYDKHFSFFRNPAGVATSYLFEAWVMLQQHVSVRVLLFLLRTCWPYALRQRLIVRCECFDVAPLLFPNQVFTCFMRI